MNWILPPFATDVDLQAHFDRCRRSASLGNASRFRFTAQYAEPRCRPAQGDRLYVRLGDRVIGFHPVVGSNRCFSGMRCVGWQILYYGDTYHALETPLPAPTSRRFSAFAVPPSPERSLASARERGVGG